MERRMRLTIFAATGGTGRQVLDQAIAAGHDVTAVVRNPQKLGREVRVVKADLSAPDPAVAEPGVRGADAVISALGAVSSSDVGVAWQGTRAIVQAMKATGVRGIVVVSAAPISTVASPGRPNPPRHDPGDGFFMRHLLSPLIKTVLRKHYADLARMEDVLRDSGLDWTVIRPPRLTDEALTVPHCERAEPSTWCRDLTRGRRPAHASRARATADDQAGDRDRLLVPGRCRHTGTRRDVGSRSRAIAVGATIPADDSDWGALASALLPVEVWRTSRVTLQAALYSSLVATPGSAVPPHSNSPSRARRSSSAAAASERARKSSRGSRPPAARRSSSEPTSRRSATSKR